MKKIVQSLTPRLVIDLVFEKVPHLIIED